MNNIKQTHKLLYTLLLLGINSAQAETALPVAMTSTARANPAAQANNASAWSLYLDNDLLANQSTDRDYTGGISLTYSGQKVAKHPLSITPLTEKLDRLTGLHAQYAQADYHLYNMEIGMTAFTPSDITKQQVQSNDRPYAGLIYLSGTHENILVDENVSWTSTLTLGVLGLDAVADFQNGIHTLTGSDKPAGWNHQISSGGEATFRYSVSRQKYYRPSSERWGLSSSSRLSLGYITEASYGASIRFGNIRSPWWSFNPNQNQYAEKNKAEDPYAKHVNELFIWAGFNAKLRAYNALLQGQFKHSEVTFSANQLEKTIIEAWLGVTKEFNSGLRFSYVLRMQSSEVKRGAADRTQRWGGIILSQSF